MGKNESGKGELTSSAVSATLPAPASDPGPTPKTAPVAAAEQAVNEAPKIDTSSIETADEPKIELWTIEAPHLAPDLDELKPASGEAAASMSGGDAETMAERSVPLVSRFTLLAASLVLAAAFGGVLGAVATASLGRSGPAAGIVTGRTGLEEFQALKEQVVQTRVDLAALKVSIDAGNRSENAHFTRLGERIDRIERSQVEPAAKLNKAIDALERLTRADVTGAIAPVAGTGRPPGALDGWVLRDVRRGTALIEGRMGIIEVDQGDVVPGLGRVEAIRKQDGRWVVVTSKGLIMSPR
jgi:hypothetical protein